MSTELKKIDISSIDISNIEFTGFEDLRKEIVQVVADNPFIEIIDNESYNDAKKRRTALRSARVKPQNDDKLIASKVQVIRKTIKGKNDELVELVLPHEEKQQEEVTRWENIKEKEREEKERLEQVRVDTIKAKIEEIETLCYATIQAIAFDKIENDKKLIEAKLNTDYDFEEFDYSFTLAKTRVETALTEKITSLQNAENERLEKIKLQAEKDAAEKKAKELQAQIDAQNAQIEKDKKEREEAERKSKEEAEKKAREEKELAEKKAKKEKDKVFEIRKNRLAEIGFLDRELIFENKELNIELHHRAIYNADVIDFENILTDAKKSIQEAKEKLEKEKEEARLKAEQEEKERLEAERLEKEANESLQKDIAERKARLSNDKEIIKSSLETYFADLHLETENEETKQFIEDANTSIQDLKTELLNQLENI